MIERRPIADFVGHLILIVTVLIVAFPIYLAVIAASHDLAGISQVPMPLLPGRSERSSFPFCPPLPSSTSASRSGPSSSG